jgi:two-component system, LytTR family, response regulator
MKSYRTIIIDDEILAAELLSLNLKELFPQIKVERICTEWSQALQLLKDNNYDLVFSDIMMPGKTGIELMRLLPGIRSKIIFVTGHQEYALDAFKCFASGYILKPVDDEELYSLVSKVIESIEQPAASQATTPNELLGIPGSKGIDYIAMGDILYLESERKCTKVVLKDRILVSSYHMGRFRELLNKETFFQTHRSYIINLKAVKRYLLDHTGIIMQNDVEIPVARAMRKELLGRFVMPYNAKGMNAPNNDA